MEINLGGKLIGEKHPVFIIAELSANHNHNYDVAEIIVTNGDILNDAYRDWFIHNTQEI